VEETSDPWASEREIARAKAAASRKKDARSEPVPQARASRSKRLSPERRPSPASRASPTSRAPRAPRTSTAPAVPHPQANEMPEEYDGFQVEVLGDYHRKKREAEMNKAAEQIELAGKNEQVAANEQEDEEDLLIDLREPEAVQGPANKGTSAVVTQGEREKAEEEEELLIDLD
jgi:hypothetical protein